MEFIPNALPTLIGSLPLKDHVQATRLVLEFTPEIPLWVQLPCYPEERLLSQFSEHLPGIRGEEDNLYFDTEDPEFETELLSFFEQYLEVTEAGKPLEQSIFAFSEKTGRGFNEFLRQVEQLKQAPYALKGQITGPFTMLTGLKDRAGKMAFYDMRIRETVVKAIGLKARYQVEQMKKRADRVLLFLDEPGLSGFGSSAMVGIPKDDVITDLKEVIQQVKEAGGLCGIHVCANTDWSVVLSAGIDILSFDAYGFFDRILIFKQMIISFMKQGGVIAWGLVPTLNQDDLIREDLPSLLRRWESCVNQLGADPDLTRSQALITPSCGTGLLPQELAMRALELTRGLAMSIRGN